MGKYKLNFVNKLDDEELLKLTLLSLGWEFQQLTPGGVTCPVDAPRGWWREPGGALSGAGWICYTCDPEALPNYLRNEGLCISLLGDHLWKLTNFKGYAVCVDAFDGWLSFDEKSLCRAIMKAFLLMQPAAENTKEA